MQHQNKPKSFKMMGIELNVKVSKDDSGNKISSIEQTVYPGAGSPPHILHDADKMIYVIEGKFFLRNGNQNIEGEAGTMVYIPKGVIHNFKNIGTDNGKILVTLTPGGHEDFLYDLSLKLENEKPTPQLMQEVGSRHNVAMVM
jgi:quercetin dioxygenase-like cupin family protein